MEEQVNVILLRNVWLMLYRQGPWNPTSELKDNSSSTATPSSVNVIASDLSLGSGSWTMCQQETTMHWTHSIHHFILSDGWTLLEEAAPCPALPLQDNYILRKNELFSNNLSARKSHQTAIQPIFWNSL